MVTLPRSIVASFQQDAEARCRSAVRQEQRVDGTGFELFHDLGHGGARLGLVGEGVDGRGRVRPRSEIACRKAPSCTRPNSVFGTTAAKLRRPWAWA